MIRAAAPVLLWALPALGCASVGSALELAPLVRREAGGDAWEALGGLVRWDANRSGGTFTAAPLLRVERGDEDHPARTEALLGLWRDQEREDGRDRIAFPFLYLRERINERGVTEKEGLLLPLAAWSSDETGARSFAVFPFWGDLESFVGWDRVRFVAFPLWVKLERFGRTSESWLFPFLSRGSGPGGRMWRIWPLAGDDQRQEGTRRRFVLWPLFLMEESPDGGGWMVTGLAGRTRHGTRTSTTLAWPFLSWTTDSADPEFLAVDAPWPIGRFLRGGTGEPRESARLLPLGSVYRSDAISQEVGPWPVAWDRRETAAGYDKHSKLVLPFWRDITTRRGRSAEERAAAPAERLRHLWPLGHVEDDGTGGRVVQVPSPLLHRAGRSWGRSGEAAWTLWHTEKSGGASTGRGPLGLFSWARSGAASSWSLSGLASVRRLPGSTEVSLLLGLLRWRSGSGGLAVLPPAFPGPGWEAVL